MSLRVLVVILVVLAAAGCKGSGTQAEGPVPWVSPDAMSATAVHWDALLDPSDEPAAVTDALAGNGDVVAGSELARSAQVLEDVLGVGLQDLAWELALTTDGPPALVFSLREGVEPSEVVDALTRAGFEAEERDGAQVLRAELDLAAQWTRVGPFLSTTAVRDDGVVVASTDTTVVDELLRREAGAPEAVTAGVEALGEVLAWQVVPGCPPEDPAAALLGEVPPSPADLTEGPGADGAGLAPYLVLAVGAGPSADDPARAAFAYGDAAAAEADAGPRVEVWERESSALTGAPLSEIFTVGEVTTKDATTTLELEGARPATIFRMLASRDTAWAACG